MEKSFVYGVSAEGGNFTDRKKETERLKMNFESGVNTILISPRRMGKTSLVKRVISTFDNPGIAIVFMDIYDCRSEYDFYNRLASSVLNQTSGKVEQWIEDAKDFLSRISPKFSFSPSPESDYSVSLGITPKTNSPEEILGLPEKIAEKKGQHIVICIDEFQQIGEFPDTLDVQKRLRSVWQHQQNVSYCLFGSKRHLMSNLFQNRRMPFYLFGDMMYLDKISTADWTEYIKSRFALKGKVISDSMCEEICRNTDNYSSYVQQLSWNVLIETDHEVTADNVKTATEMLLAQCDSLFIQQIAGLTSYQMNFLRAIYAGHHSDLGTASVMEEFNLGCKSNITRLRNALVERELVEIRKDGLHFCDPIFRLWFGRECL